MNFPFVYAHHLYDAEVATPIKASYSIEISACLKPNFSSSTRISFW